MHPRITITVRRVIDHDQLSNRIELVKLPNIRYVWFKKSQDYLIHQKHASQLSRLDSRSRKYTKYGINFHLSLRYKQAVNSHPFAKLPSPSGIFPIPLNPPPLHHLLQIQHPRSHLSTSTNCDKILSNFKYNRVQPYNILCRKLETLL
jgi:hypothetical protein